LVLLIRKKHSTEYPSKGVRWAFGKLEVEEWLVEAVIAM